MYRIYPSALNGFQRLLDATVDAEDFSNLTEDGDYRCSPDEIAAEREQDLIDSINRVPHEPIELADRGTAFNEIVDCIVLNKKSTRDDVRIYHNKAVHETRIRTIMDTYDNMYEQHIPYRVDSPENIEAHINGFTFKYDVDLCKTTAEYFTNTIPQHLCEATLDTHYGKVMLYGYADYIFPNKVVDLKTCGRYDFGKYQHNWQKELYPYCLLTSGEMQECESFEFYVVQLKNPTKATPLLTGVDYREEYNYNHKQATARLQEICERFIEWLEQHRKQITDKKIFNYR